MEYVIAIKNTTELHPMILALAETEGNGTKQANLFFSEKSVEEYIMKRWQSNDEAFMRVIEANPPAKSLYLCTGMIRQNYAIMVKDLNENDTLYHFLQSFHSSSLTFTMFPLYRGLV